MKKEKNKPEKAEEVNETAEEVTETAEEKLQKALDEKNEQFLRLCAEYDNFRKRSQKEKQDIYSSSQAEVIKELLPVLDNFDRAANNKDGNFEDYKKGIDLIFNQFGEILKKLGVESYGERGDAFDPNIHNAVMTVEDAELGENEIASVFSKGYKLGDRVIREAVVQVANS
ncbi:MAG: nucleotide exchange factor GrpE [Ruminococcaceae bacterium]|nr:nucleotide exchange factor GrpE [Oscillospiraceae bacterium]